MGVTTQPNVYGLFAACIPQASRERFHQLTLRKRQGLVPDMLCTLQWNDAGPTRRLLFELKTLHYGVSTYPRESTQRCYAVAQRASRLPNEYCNKARQVDANYCGTPDGSTGPVLARLQAFEPVKGVVFGHWGETSPDVSPLLSAFASQGAVKHWRRMGRQSPAEARGSLAWLLRRRWAMVSLRENARLLLSRLEYVGRGADRATRRKTSAEEAAAARERWDSSWQRRGPFLHRGFMTAA